MPSGVGGRGAREQARRGGNIEWSSESEQEGAGSGGEGGHVVHKAGRSPYWARASSRSEVVEAGAEVEATAATATSASSHGWRALAKSAGALARSAMKHRASVRKHGSPDAPAGHASPAAALLAGQRGSGSKRDARFKDFAATRGFSPLSSHLTGSLILSRSDPNEALAMAALAGPLSAAARAAGPSKLSKMCSGLKPVGMPRQAKGTWQQEQAGAGGVSLAEGRGSRTAPLADGWGTTAPLAGQRAVEMQYMARLIMEEMVEGQAGAGAPQRAHVPASACTPPPLAGSGSLVMSEYADMALSIAQELEGGEGGEGTVWVSTSARQRSRGAACGVPPALNVMIQSVDGDGVVMMGSPVGLPPSPCHSSGSSQGRQAAASGGGGHGEGRGGPGDTEAAGAWVVGAGPALDDELHFSDAVSGYESANSSRVSSTGASPLTSRRGTLEGYRLYP